MCVVSGRCMEDRDDFDVVNQRVSLMKKYRARRKRVCPSLYYINFFFSVETRKPCNSG